MFSRCTRRFCANLVRIHLRHAHGGPTAGRRSYAEAVTTLNSIQSNFAAVDAFRKAGGKKNESAIAEMLEWCHRAELDPADLSRLNVIHIAGTKGKGSTSAFVSSILAQYVGCENSPTKVGLYTSPHLRYVRERIQVDNTPISEQVFADSFFEVWDRLQSAARRDTIPQDKLQNPVYFQFLTILAWHTYLKLGVDTAVIECGIGGEYDSTNVLQGPVTTGVTALGIDHVLMLGDTVESIAWHKAGIMKAGTPAFTVQQPGKALDVLYARAKERGVHLTVVPDHPEIAQGKVRLGLAGDFQKSNASLAVEIVASHLRSLGHTQISTSGRLPEQFITGLENARLGGRCETRKEPGISWHIDGAHTVESIEVASKWFVECVKSARISTASSEKVPRILIFNQQARSGEPLLRKLYEVLASHLRDQHPITHAIFCSNLTFEDTGYRPDLISMNTNQVEVDNLEVQEKLAKIWDEIDSSTEVRVVQSVNQAVDLARKIARSSAAEDVQVFAVGSVHLIGGVLEVLETASTPTGSI